MSNNKKLRFSVRRTPLSTRPLARRSRTCLSWKPILRTFQVSPGSRREEGGEVLVLVISRGGVEENTKNKRYGRQLTTQ
jgi:hypothetical protein